MSGAIAVDANSANDAGALVSDDQCAHERGIDIQVGVCPLGAQGEDLGIVPGLHVQGELDNFGHGTLRQQMKVLRTNWS